MRHELAVKNTTVDDVPHKWLIIVTIMTVAILEVLDSTIVNVSLPAMMPSLGANQEQITWILTSYIVAAAMMMPLTGFLSKRFGTKKLLYINITGFMLTSFLCGISQNLGEIVVFRLLQGAFGAALVPLSQSILRTTFPLEQQGKAMAIWGMGIMVAPVFGPSIGGYITEYSTWRWIFYINTPVCIMSLFLTWLAVPASKPIHAKIDWVGVILMFIGVGCLQLFLDQGNSKDWFNSNFIVLMAIFSLLGFTLFLYRSYKQKNPVIKLAIFKDRNFALSCILMALFAASVFTVLTLEPIMLESLFGYTSISAGMTISPTGIASAFGMMFASNLMRKVNIKLLLLIALLITAAGSYTLAAYNLQATQTDFIIANALHGFGMGLFMVPMATYALATLNEEDITEGAGLFSYNRMLGTSVGISIFSTIVSRAMQSNWHTLSGHINIFSNNLRLWLSQQHSSMQNLKTISELSNMVANQANMIAFIDAYRAIAIVILLLIPVVLATRKVRL